MSGGLCSPTGVNVSPPLAMIRALKNNMWEVDIVLFEGEIIGPIACFDLVMFCFWRIWYSGDCKRLT